MPLDVSIWSALIISVIIVLVSLLYDVLGDRREKTHPQLPNKEETPNGN
jgi:hypothetical protein